MDTVCAWVVARRPGAEPAPEVAALERQTRKPDRVTIAAPGEPSGHGPPGPETWLWLLDEGVLPRPDALERLLEAAAGSDRLPAPDLLASKVVRPDGSLDSRSLPAAQVRDADLAVAAFEHRVLSLRVARRGSLLVRRSAIEAVTSLRPRLDVISDDLECTARLLRNRPGVLVPASVVVRGPGAEPPRSALAPRELARRTRLLMGDAIEVRDKPWFAFYFLEEALAELPLNRRYRDRPSWLRRPERHSTPS